ncbi:hypothetical protein PAHAL_9G301000 [Panicum hallii]|uniref:protein-serine/threonine phosphatase n=1 Tax=Panicum hallii TaxID=206008 RepID=A0A2S3IMG9_9POAL|nr:hypothetical protein PAHAL_9G301000 [Panicum hallii]
MWGEGSETFATVCSRRGEKGTNQDCSIVWEGFGCQDDTIFCGIFDGHGPWGHYVAKAVLNSLPPSLLCHWQEALTLASLIDHEKKLSDSRFDLWKQSYVAACAAVDDELRRSRRLDAVYSGSTALSIVKQGDLMVVANVGDSRAVLGTTSQDGALAAVQLTIDFKPNLPQEKERIRRCNGQVYCLADEPGVYRVWQPSRDLPGLAMSRAFGDYSVKDYSVISAGGDAEEDQQQGPVRHPRHRRRLGRAVERGDRADRGGDAGQGEGGEAAGGVRRPRVEAQAVGHRCRRLLGDLPLLPLAAVVGARATRKRASIDVRETTKCTSQDYDHRARCIRGWERNCRRPRFRTCSLSHDCDTAAGG